MVSFHHRGIFIEATVETVPCAFMLENQPRMRIDRIPDVRVNFWGYIIQNGNLDGLAFAKSCTQYFLQCYWKRSNKQGTKIELGKTLKDGEKSDVEKTLNFVARQKDNQHYLHIYVQENGRTTNEVYLDGQETIMLDIALGKAVNLLTPTPHFVSPYPFGYY